jgi:hypothetical protein
VPTVFVYAFAPRHTYEIAPSIIDGNDTNSSANNSGDGSNDNSNSDGVTSCEDALTTLMAGIQFPATQQNALNNSDNAGAINNMALAAPGKVATSITTLVNAEASATMSTTTTGSILGAATSSNVTVPADDAVDEDCL